MHDTFFPFSRPSTFCPLNTRLQTFSPLGRPIPNHKTSLYSPRCAGSNNLGFKDNLQRVYVGATLIQFAKEIKWKMTPHPITLPGRGLLKVLKVNLS